MFNKILQFLSFSTPTLLVLLMFIWLFILMFALYVWSSNRDDIIRKKLASISDPMRKQVLQGSEKVERARLLANVAAVARKRQTVSLIKSIRNLMKGLGKKEITIKLIMVSIIYFAIMVFVLRTNVGTVGIIFPAVFLLTLRWLVNQDRKLYLEKVVDQLPMAIDLLVRSLQAGLNVSHAITLCAKRLDEPIKSEFARIQRDMVAGLSTPAAVEKFYDRVPRASVAFFSALIAAQNRSGGSLAGGLSVLSETLRTRRSVQNKIQALTSEPRTSMKVLLGIPAVFIGISFGIQPDKTLKFITTTEGQIYLFPMLVWSFIGVIVMLKMTDIRD